jgi:hypothetical protein
VTSLSPLYLLSYFLRSLHRQERRIGLGIEACGTTCDDAGNVIPPKRAKTDFLPGGAMAMAEFLV